MTFKQRFLKFIYPVLKGVYRLIGKHSKKFSSDKPALQSFYGLSSTMNNGEEIDFESFRGKKVMIVNTAIDCGFAQQFGDLQKLFAEKSDKLEILAFPSNDFKQDSNDDHVIDEFCKSNYGVGFPVMRKSKVLVHSTQNKVFEWLTDKDRNGWNSHVPVWNFCKYLVDENGNLTNIFETTETPLSKNVIAAVDGGNQ